MRPNKQNNALIALQEAIRLRQDLGHKIWDPICPYDCADRLGLEVRFVDFPSLEGMYSKGSPPIILVSSLRPAVRATYTCAHEIAHHIFNHGTHVDTDITTLSNINAPKEFLAQTFAGFFLMPKIAIERAFARRGWSIASCTPEQLYTIACWFGVGYETLISHMEYGLKILTQNRANELKTVPLEQIRISFAGEKVSTNLIVVDPYWDGRAVDVQVGDKIMFPQGTRSNAEKSHFIRFKEGSDIIYQATAPGIERFNNPTLNWSVFSRISRRGYTGRSIFRFLEDPDYDQRKPTSSE